MVLRMGIHYNIKCLKCRIVIIMKFNLHIGIDRECVHGIMLFNCILTHSSSSGVKGIFRCSCKVTSLRCGLNGLEQEIFYSITYITEGRLRNDNIDTML